MNETQPIDARPLQCASAGERGILLLHGYTSSPYEVRFLGEHLCRAGFGVEAPLLPGHATTARDLNRYTWRDMEACAEEAFFALKERHQQVYVGGVSMGGLLALQLAARGLPLAGIIPMVPPLALKDPLHHLLPWLSAAPLVLPKSKDIRTCIEDPKLSHLVWSYDQTPVRFAAELCRLMHHVRERLPKVHCPTLAVFARHDRAVPISAAAFLEGNIGSRDVTVRIYENSGHCITADAERDTLFEDIRRWVSR